MAGMPRPRPSPRMLDGLHRIRHDSDFVAFREHLEAELAYFKDLLVGETDPTAFGQLQGRARQLQELLKYIHPEG